MLNRLQGLRAVAAYMVVIFHAFEFLSTLHMGIPRIASGAAGVDLFFVISGFIMVYVAGARDTPAGFLINRIARIVPLYWLGTLLIVAAASYRSWLAPGVLLDPQSVLASLFFVPAFDAEGHLAPALRVGWTLNWEMMFYLLFTMSMFAPRRFRIPLLITLMTAVFILGLISPTTASSSFYGKTIIFEFAAGCLIATAFQDHRAAQWLKRLSPWGLIAGGAALLVGANFIHVDDDTRAIFRGAPAALIVTGVLILDLT